MIEVPLWSCVLGMMIIGAFCWVFGYAVGCLRERDTWLDAIYDRSPKKIGGKPWFVRLDDAA